MDFYEDCRYLFGPQEMMALEIWHRIPVLGLGAMVSLVDRNTKLSWRQLVKKIGDACYFQSLITLVEGD